jgi:alkylation response protein AidB-like acyl-CoA dehydrogenase
LFLPHVHPFAGATGRSTRSRKIHATFQRWRRRDGRCNLKIPGRREQPAIILFGETSTMNIAVKPGDVAANGALSRDELLRRAREIAPRLRERAARSEEMRRAPEETVAEYVDAGLIRLTQPRRFGGSEAGWDVLCEISQILAAECGSQAWIQRIMADHAQMVSTFPGEAQDDVWSHNNNALICASFDPVGRATRVEGGFRMNGRHAFCSGVDYADWLICGGYVYDGERREGPHFFLVPRSDATIIDDWRTMGLAGTGSKSFEIKDVFVPSHRFLDGSVANQGAGPGTKINTSFVYRIPRGSGITTSGFTALTVGMTQGVLREWLDLTAGRKSRGVDMSGLATMREIASRSSGEIAAAELLYMTTLRKALGKLERGEEIPMSDRAEAKRNMSLAAQFCVAAGNRLFNAAGGRALFLDGALQRQYRNMLMAASHHALYWDSASAEYGKYILEAHGAPAS